MPVAGQHIQSCVNGKGQEIIARDMQFVAKTYVSKSREKRRQAFITQSRFLRVRLFLWVSRSRFNISSHLFVFAFKLNLTNCFKKFQLHFFAASAMSALVCALALSSETRVKKPKACVAWKEERKLKECICCIFACQWQVITSGLLLSYSRFNLGLWLMMY